MPSITFMKGLLQDTESELQAHSKPEKVLALCDSACRHSWNSVNLAKKLIVDGQPTKLTVHGIKTQKVKLKFTPVPSDGSCSPFDMKQSTREDLVFGTDFIDVDMLKTKYPHLEPIAPKE